MRQIITKGVAWFHPDPTQPRKTFDMEEIRQLGESLKLGQWVPLLVKADGTIIDGGRRHSAASLAGVETLDAIIVDGLTPAEIKEIQLVTSLHKADLKPYEQFLGCAEWKKSNPGGTDKELASRIKKDASMVSRILSLERCIPPVQEAAKAGVVGISDWTAISKVSEPEQYVLLAAKLNGSSRDELERKGRKARNGLSAGAKISRIRIPIPGGGYLVLTMKKPIGMAEVVEILADLLKAAKAAAEKYDVKTWVAMMRDNARKAGE